MDDSSPSKRLIRLGENYAVDIPEDLQHVEPISDADLSYIASGNPVQYPHEQLQTNISARVHSTADRHSHDNFNLDHVNSSTYLVNYAENIYPNVDVELSLTQSSFDAQIDIHRSTVTPTASTNERVDNICLNKYSSETELDFDRIKTYVNLQNLTVDSEATLTQVSVYLFYINTMVYLFCACEISFLFSKSFTKIITKTFYLFINKREILRIMISFKWT